MFIQKIFHLRQPLPEARQTLRELGTWNDLEKDQEVRCSKLESEGVSRVELKTTTGEIVCADIVEVAGDEPDRLLFRSVGGMMELAGMIELYPIRANLTEAVLTVEYEAISSLQKAIEAMSAALDGFLNRQLARIEGAIERARNAGPADVSGIARFA